MDYKYIEQLLERYWNCETTLREEQILHTFFLQEDIPAHLCRYKDVFCAHEDVANMHLGEDFDDRILALVDDSPVKVVNARRMTFRHRVRPFCQAAGLVAVMLTIGMAAQHSFQSPEDAGESQFAQQQMPDDPDAEFTHLPDGAGQTSASIPAKLSVDTLSAAFQGQTGEIAQ